MNYLGILQASESNQSSTLLRKYKAVFGELKAYHGQSISHERLAEITLELLKLDHDYVI